MLDKQCPYTFNTGAHLPTATVHHGDCLEVMRSLPDDSVDAIVTDPPYGLGFMGKAWDQLPPGLEWAVECLRVLKPGGHLLAFGGTRTWHRLACAVEDAGFEVRDSIAWLYGSGFPKSLDVSKAIDKAAGAEREVTGWRPNINRTKRRDEAGAFHSSEGGMFREDRDVFADTAPATPAAEQWQGWGTALKPAFEPVVVGRKPLAGTVAANVLAHGTGALNIDGCRVGLNGEEQPRGSGVTPSSVARAGGPMPGVGGNVTPTAGRWPANVVLDESLAEGLDAARFFYVAKAPAKERPRTDNGVAHPTVKPLALMRWLVRLVTPPAGVVLEPFAGSGTTVEACLLEGFNCVAIEREADYLPLIEARIARVAPEPSLLDLADERSA